VIIQELHQDFCQIIGPKCAENFWQLQNYW